MRNLCKAIKQAHQAHIDFDAFDTSLHQEIPEEVAEMELTLDAWEKDKLRLDPFKLPKAGMSMSIVCLTRY